jgi:hypothetical protein
MRNCAIKRICKHFDHIVCYYQLTVITLMKLCIKYYGINTMMHFV